MENDTKELNIEKMIDSPEDYGFRWEYGHLERKGVRVTQGAGAPLMQHFDVSKIRATFGDDYLLKSMSGQSHRVRDQGTLREALAASLPLRSNDREMKRMILRAALGQRSARKYAVREVFRHEDGTEFATAAELKTYTIQQYLAEQVDAK